MLEEKKKAEDELKETFTFSNFAPEVDNYFKSKDEKYDKKFLEFCYQKMLALCKVQQIQWKNINGTINTGKTEEFDNLQNVKKEHLRMLQIMKNKKFNKMVTEKPNSSPSRQIRDVMEAECKLFQGNKDELIQSYRLNPSAIEEQFSQTGFQTLFQEYTQANHYKEEEGDMLTFSDFTNLELVSFDPG